MYEYFSFACKFIIERNFYVFASENASRTCINEIFSTILLFDSCARGVNVIVDKLLLDILH